MKIRHYQIDDAQQIADLFHDSVHGIAKEKYSAEQLEAWAPTPPDYQYWSVRLALKNPYVCIVDHKVVGFMELEASGYINCAYTHKDFQRHGIATALYKTIEDEARRLHLQRLHLDASLIAVPFFEKHGFIQVRINQIERAGQTLKNVSMEKYLQLAR